MPSAIDLPYQENMIHYYHSLSDFEGFSLLESIDKHYGRYDIVTALPYDIQNNVAQPTLPRGTKNYGSCNLPFQGGVIAALSYEYGNYLRGLSSLDSILNSQLNFNTFQFFDWGIVVDHKLKRTQLYARNTQKCTPAIIKSVMKRWKNTESPSKKILCHSYRSLVERLNYKKDVLIIQEALRQGRCYQVNYSQPFELEVSSNDPWDLYRQIRQYNPVPYAGFMTVKNDGIVSFSPERFLQLTSGGAIATSPIKGTIGRDSDPYIDKLRAITLKNCEKNSAENIMIVDLLRNDLSRICRAGSVQVQQLKEIQSFPSVHHLVSHINGVVLDEIQPIDALLSCFPGGSITGAPKIEAMKMILELEAYPRGMYCGSLAYISSHGYMDSNIAIRTLQCKDNRVQMSAGGGVVLDSHWEHEYAECMTKISGILKAFT